MNSEEHPGRIAGFELVEKIGEGSMGVVYRARQTSMDREVAVKVLAPRLARSPGYVARFEREARSAARLNHPNIVAGIDVGEDAGYHYFAMELVEGPTVQELLDDKDRFDEKLAVEIACQVADALAHAWDKGLVHRDVKPGNLVLTRDGTVKITDLGLAKYTLEDTAHLTDTGTTVGTAYYISPEQATGEEEIDVRSDIYSLGATLFHMVTGEPPYAGTPVSVMTQHVQSEVPDPRARNSAVSPELCDVIGMMMAKNPRERYRTPEELLSDLRRVADGKKPLLVRTDSELALLAEGADWEDAAEPEVVSRDEMARLKSRLGWGRAPEQMSLGLRILVVILAVLAITMSALYYFGIL